MPLAWVGLDLLGVDLTGQRAAVVETTDPPRPAAEDSFALPLLDLARESPALSCATASLGEEVTYS